MAGARVNLQVHTGVDPSPDSDQERAAIRRQFNGM